MFFTLCVYFLLLILNKVRQISFLLITGECCPSCPEYQFTKELEFTNCPTETVTLQLDASRPYVVYDPQLTWIDNSGIWRDVNETFIPDVTWFWWVGKEVVQEMSVVITSRSPEGHVDKDVCQINTVVKGMHSLSLSFCLNSWNFLGKKSSSSVTQLRVEQ